MHNRKGAGPTPGALFTSMTELALVALASLFAGCVDAIVGGGGLILVPALFGMYPGAAPATLLGTNKGSGIWGTAWATWQFSRRVQLSWAALLPAALAAFAGSFAGAWALTLVNPDGLRKALPLVLLAVLAYTLARKDLGRHHAPRLAGAAQALPACTIGMVVGFYDGFFGPGTGSLLIFLYVAVLGFDFLRSSALAKAVNWASNIAATVLFVWQGSWIPQAALAMAVGNGLGGWLGAHVALKKGSGWVRGVFIAVVGLLILRLGWQMVRS